MHPETIRNAVGIIGNVVSFALFLAPVPVFRKIIKRKDVEEFSPNPYLATILNCGMWVFYGIIRPHSTLVWTINGIGLVIELIYISIYLRYANKDQRLYVFKVFGGEVVFVGLVAGLVMGLAHTLARRILVLGIIAVVFNIAMYGMPLDIMYKVIKTKSIEYMPVLLSVCNFLNGGIWVGFAQLVHFDLFLTISNGSGVFLAIIQLLLIGCYWNSTPKRSDQKKPAPVLPTTTSEIKNPV